MSSINALSCAPAVRTWMENSSYPRILHVFDRVCNLIDERREVLSIVTPGIGNGPFNLVVEEEVLFSAHINASSPVSIRENQIMLGDLTIHTARAKPWNPRPDWERLYARRDEILDQLLSLSLPDQQLPIPNIISSSLSFALASEDISTAKTTASQIAGLGIGLTPTGDDFILGAVLAAWIIHPLKIASKLAGEVTEIAAPLTTSLSGAWLRSAGRGEAGIRWHNLFNALIASNKMAVQESVEQLLAVGYSSGADALAGFMGTFVRLREISSHKIS